MLPHAAMLAAFGGFRSKQIDDIEAFSSSLLKVAFYIGSCHKIVGSSVALTGHLPPEDRLSALAWVTLCTGLLITNMATDVGSLA